MNTKERNCAGTVCPSTLFTLPPVKKRAVSLAFDGGNVSSDAGLLALRQVDRSLGLSRALAKVLPDPREPLRIEHSLLSLVRQRLYGLCCGYEDLNAHDTLRHDLAWQTAVERLRPLASSPTLCRFENSAGRAAAWAVHRVLLDPFIASHRHAPKELILDFDTTADLVHGQQEGAFFHAHHGDYCFLPLYVFCGEQLLVACLRGGDTRPARGAWAILKFLVQALREKWPQVKILVRADSGFARWRMLRWCEDHGVHYIVGFGKNSRLLALAQRWTHRAANEFAHTQEKQRLFGEVKDAAWSWDRKRRVLLKAEHHEPGANPRLC